MKTERIIEPNQEIFAILESSLKEVSAILPNSHVEAIGAMTVPMLGRPELDIMVISDHIAEDSALLVESGYKQGPVVDRASFLKKMVNGVEVAVQILPTDSKIIEMHRAIMNLLRTNDELRSRYEEFKKTLEGKGREEYRARKSEWIQENIKPLL